jgi:DNA-binding transcriptional LysR family regulator
LIESEPFIRYDRRSFGGRQVDVFLRKKRIAVREAIEADELHGIAQLVARGMGVALLPKSAGIGAWPRGTVAHDLGDDTFHREIGLVERARRADHDAAAQLAECIAEAAARDTGLDRAKAVERPARKKRS